MTTPWAFTWSPTSLPTRGGRIEVLAASQGGEGGMSLPTRGGWIEILNPERTISCGYCPSPHGEGGLKCKQRNGYAFYGASLPTRGGWIEISRRSCPGRADPVPPHTGRVD